MRYLWALAPLLAATGAHAQEQAPPASPANPRADDSELAKQLSNPVANLISVPLQNNYDCCFGPAEAQRYVLNIQPVVPLSLTKDWNVIIRTIVPVIAEGETIAGQGSTSGFGDITQSFFFSPKATHNGIVWAIGPVFTYPSGGSRRGTEKWGAGPTALLLKQAEGGLTFGMLANQVWSIAGDEDRANVSQMLLQPFLSKTLPDSTTFSLNSETIRDWHAKTWLVPINLSVTHIFKFGGQRVQIGPTARYYVETPEGGPHWGARLTFTFLFPKGK